MLIVVIGLFATSVPALAQSARIQFTGIEHLAPKASETVDVNVDERLIQIAAKVLSSLRARSAWQSSMVALRWIATPPLSARKDESALARKKRDN